MKKVLSLVLAFAMILGSFGFVFASQFPDVEDTEYYSEPVNVLSGFGVIGGFPDGTFGPEKEVTRAQMATMVVNALGMSVTGKSDTKFSDVPASHWASGFIAYATSVGFVAGYPDGTFKPDAQVTYDQALTMIVAALGYKAEALPGSWPGNFVNKAQGLGILDTCKTTGTDNAPRQDIACFLYDALGCAIGYTDKDGAWHANDADGDGTGDDSMYVRLGAVAYNGGTGAGKPFVVDGDEEAVIDMSKYFGAYVTAYASKDDAQTIVAIKEVLSEFVTGDVATAGDKIEGDSTYKVTDPTTAQVGAFKYFDNGEVATGKKYTAANGNDDAIFAVKKSGTKISEIYSVQVWTPQETVRVDEAMLDEIKDDQKFATYTFPTEDDEIDTSSFLMMGKTSLDDLAEDDIVTIYLDGITSGDIAKLEISTEKVEGEITRVNTAGTKYTIGGTAYDVATGTLAVTGGSAAGLAPEKEGTFFLNYAGQIADFDETKDTTKNYAVILDMGKDTGRYNTSEFFLKLFLADGTEAEFAVDDSATGMANYFTGATPNAWNVAPVTSPAVALATQDVVEYEIDSDNVVVGLTVLNTINDFTPGKYHFDVNGIYQGTPAGKQAVKDTVIFSYTGNTGDEKKAASYSVIELDKILDNDCVTVIGGFDTTSNNINAILVTGVEETTDIYAVFGAQAGKDANGDIWNVLYDGAAKEMTAKSSTGIVSYTTGSAATLFTLTFDGELIKKVTPATAINNAAHQKDLGVPTAKISISGNVFTLAGTKYSLASDAKVYIYDESDKAWSAGKLSAVKYNYIYLIDTDSTADSVYDIVLVFRD